MLVHAVLGKNAHGAVATELACAAPIVPKQRKYYSAFPAMLTDAVLGKNEHGASSNGVGARYT